MIYSFGGVLLLFLMIFSGNRNNKRPIESMEVDVKEEEGIFFTDDLEVIDLMTNKSAAYVIGVEARDIDPKTLEARVEANPFVKDAQVFRDLESNLKVRVKQSKPIARVFTNGKQDRYIDSQGRVLPINAKHTARVPLIETTFDFRWENMNESDFAFNVFELLKYIEEDEFWKAQIAHIFVKNNGEIELFPQVSKQKIEFGKPEGLEEKFSKLMTFYKEILPKKGWNYYETVNVKFKDQIICE